MAHNQLEAEKNFTSSLISALSTLEETPTPEVIKTKAQQLAEMLNYTGDLEGIIGEAMIAVDSRMGQGISLIDTEAEHDEEWVFKRDDIQWTYSEAYEAYLKQQGFHPNIVRSLGDVSGKILGHLQDPSSEGTRWDRRGLVIGHVQSGKTANYLGLIARAADAGYKFIVVIAGIHNNLRTQTQERVDEGFVGRSSNPEDRQTVGVGLTAANYPHPATLTNVHNDFNKKTADQSGWELNDFSKPIILVIKKNVRTLESLFNWLKEMNAKGGDRISDVPMLLIDDEADNASINTNKEDLDPTRTNTMIRKILGLFDKSCYVGYTATPFANIFINPESYDDVAHEELFPRDFIYCLDAPNTYFGPARVFEEENFNPDPVIPIEDAEEYLPFSHKKDDDIKDLPPSLYRAIDQFIVARAIRNLRKQKNKHASMMINASRFVSVQNRIRDFVSIYEKSLRQAVKANYAMPENIASQDPYMANLRSAYDEQYSGSGHKWEEIKTELNGVFETLRIFVVNSKSDEKLDFKKYEKDGIGLTAIAIGGLSLSRGLTIEGLSVSYMYRNTRMYDTLMQMGRWFGYRPGYDDVCRIHLSPDSIDWYGHISDASEELRQQIKRMRRDGLSPRQFGLYVKAHPDRLLITAVNKMRAGEKFTVRTNLSGRIVESYVLPEEDEINQKNEELISEYWRTGFGAGSEKIFPATPGPKGWFIADAATDELGEFLSRFQVHPSFANTKAAALEYLRAISEDHSNSDVLLISISDRDEDMSSYRLGTQDRRSATIPDGAWRTSKNRVASRGDEKLGLSPVQLERAESLADDGKKPSDTHYREVRNKPLLMLHSLNLGKGDSIQERVPAFGISYPPGDYTTEVEVVANKVWVEKMHGPSVDAPEDDEDYGD